MTTDQRSRMEHLVLILNEACRRYYVDTKNGPAMSDKMYDKMLAELTELERVTDEYLPDSPTKRVGFTEKDTDKIEHLVPVLSLRDTKSVDEMLYFLGEQEGLLSWKIDGLSLILHYSGGKLIMALTRGDGTMGKNVLQNVMKMRDVPKEIPQKGYLVVRGEGCLSTNDFEQIKRTKEGEHFSNPRNLAAGIINTTRTSNVLLRHMTFIAHSIMHTQGKLLRTRSEQLAYLKNIGFRVVPNVKVLNFQLKGAIETFTENVNKWGFPVDGLVLALDDVEYGESLGCTAKFPKHSIAFKWPDETKLTKVTGMKWSVSGTGLITPVVIFEPITLEGTVVKQANLHNLRFFESLSIGVGDTIKVYKANKIIPEVEENMTRSKTETYPRKCPECGSKTIIKQTERTRKLYCTRCSQ